MNVDRYLAAGDGPEIELRVRASRFLGRLFRADDEGAATRHLEAIRRRHHDAAHHCWATRIGEPEATIERLDDDGEPSGTAGRPILDALRGANLHDALLVVTRYFGGTKLGSGGLARAYGDAARQARAAAPVRSMVLTGCLLARCEYDDVGRLEAALARHGERLLDVERDWADRPRYRIRLARSEVDALGDLLVAATAGRIEIERLEDGRQG